MLVAADHFQYTFNIQDATTGPVVARSYGPRWPNSYASWTHHSVGTVSLCGKIARRPVNHLSVYERIARSTDLNIGVRGHTLLALQSCTPSYANLRYR
jgi:hypothetical protein